MVPYEEHDRNVNDYYESLILSYNIFKRKYRDSFIPRFWLEIFPQTGEKIRDWFVP